MENKLKDVGLPGDIHNYDWHDFRTLWNAIAALSGEEEAWKAIHAVWQERAGETEEFKKKAEPDEKPFFLDETGVHDDGENYSHSRLFPSEKSAFHEMQKRKREIMMDKESVKILRESRIHVELEDEEMFIYDIRIRPDIR